MRRLVCILAIFLCSVAAVAQIKTDWLPITPQDLAVKEVPGNPGAPAIQLYYSDQIDDRTPQMGGEEFVYQRIKILSEKALRPHPEGYADVEIIVPGHFFVTEIKARTIHPDGKIIDFTGKPFDKVVVKSKGVKLLAKAFTLPEVTVGSIVEYKYRMNGPEYTVYDNQWVIQHELYTVKETFFFKPMDTEGEFSSSYVTEHLDRKPTLAKNNTLSLEVENMPAFETEPHMPPEDNYKPRVQFYYTEKEVGSLEKFWSEEGKKMTEGVERFIGNHAEARAAATEAIGNEADPEKKLRKLYERAQKIRNLTYERERTAEEQKRENLKDNGSVADIFKRDFGYHDEITRAFVAMARAAGFEAYVIKTSNRSDKFFDQRVLSSRQFDSEIADVVLNGKETYLDPGTKFCPYGLVRWPRTATAAMKLDKKGPKLITTPSSPYQNATTRRGAAVQLTPDGTLKGEVMVRFEGTDALEHRLDATETDEAGRTKALEDELKGWLPSGAIVKVTKAEGWQGTNEPLDVYYSLEMPGYATVAGKRVLMPSFLFRARQNDAFTHADRKYPIYFPYAFSEVDRVTIKVPEGFTVEGMAPKQQANLAYAAYTSESKFSAGELVTDRSLLFNGIFFEPARYSELKDFFSKVQSGDEQQAVLKAGGAVSAQKSQD